MGISNQSNAASQSYANKDVINQLPLDKAFKNSFKDVRAGGKKRKSRNNKATKKSMNNKKGKGNNNNQKGNNSNSNNKNKHKKSRKQSNKRKNQKAGSVNFVLRVGEERIGGLARVDKFETQPVYKNGVPEVKQNDLGNRGSQGLCGGGKRKSGKKSNKNKSNKKKSNNNNSNNNNSNNNSGNNNNNLNNNKKKRKSKKKSRKMKGGNGENCFKMQQDALPSHYSDNMTTRKFDCNQPNWDPKCT